MGRRAHQPDPAQRRQVEGLAAYGIPETDIAEMLEIDPKTLRKHYCRELELGGKKANAQVAGFLFNSAKNGNVTAQIFWLKTRARWRESPTDINHTAVVGYQDLSLYSEDELIASIERDLAASPELRRILLKSARQAEEER